MNPPPYQPGYPNQPGYPPPQRQGMGCFAKGCITLVVVVILLAVLMGVAGWYLVNSLRPFLSATPVSVHTFQANDAQYQDVMRRFREFAQALNTGKAATFTLSADDINTLIARDPDFASNRGRLFVDLKDSEIIAEGSYPVEDRRRRSSSTQKAYFNGRAFFSASYSGGEAALHVRKVESLDGKPMADYLLWLTNQVKADEVFNQFLHDERRKGSAWAAAVSKVDKIVVENSQIVITSKEGQPPADPVPVPGASPGKVDNTDDGE